MAAEEQAHDVIVAVKMLFETMADTESLTRAKLEEANVRLFTMFRRYMEQSEYRASLHDCPSPLLCSERFTCQKQKGNANVCSDGLCVSDELRRGDRAD